MAQTEHQVTLETIGYGGQAHRSSQHLALIHTLNVANLPNHQLKQNLKNNQLESFKHTHT